MSSDFANDTVCLETEEYDTTTEDGSTPAVGEVQHYLIRVMNDCPGGTGSMGADSNGTARSGLVCP